jgi:hypothetical protein
MASQRSFDDLPPFQAHSETSRMAAIHTLPKAGTQRRRVFDYIRGREEYGATDEEIQLVLQMSGNTERPRRVELWNAGLIRDSGEKRRGSSGLMAVVWVTA